MSLCILLRMAGGATMGCDTALSVTSNGMPYRILGFQDDEKVISCHGNLVFCSGLLDACRHIRSYIRSSNQLDVDGLQRYVRNLFKESDYPGIESGDTVILVYRPSGHVYMLRAKDHFSIHTLPTITDQGVMSVTTIGVHAEEAYDYLMRWMKDSGNQTALLRRVFDAVVDEEVGGELMIHSVSSNGATGIRRFPIKDKKPIRRIAAPHYARCNIYAESGYFNGIVRAQDFQDQHGNSMLTEEGKIDADWLDLMGINVKNDAGQTVLTIDQTGLKFNPAYAPIKYQYSANNVNWHDTMAANDKYRRESFDGGTTWGSGYQFVGKDGLDGSDGSDADVNYNNIKKALQKANGLSTAYLTMDEVGAPNIYGGNIYGGIFHGNEFNIYQESSGVSGGLFLYGDVYGASHSSPMFGIKYHTRMYQGVPGVSISSPSAAHVMLGYDPDGMTQSVHFYGNLDFSEADSVSGLHLTFS